MADFILGVTCSVGSSGELLVRLGVPVLDDYLRFVAARCRPNTVLATAYDLLVFFRQVDKAPVEVSSADVFGFIGAQRTGSDGPGLRAVVDGAGLSARTVRRRLSGERGDRGVAAYADLMDRTVYAPFGSPGPTPTSRARCRTWPTWCRPRRAGRRTSARTKSRRHDDDHPERPAGWLCTAADTAGVSAQ